MNIALRKMNNGNFEVIAMNGIRALIILCFLSSFLVQAGAQDKMSQADTRKLTAIKNTLELDSLQLQQIDSLFVSTAFEVNRIDSLIKEVERSDLPEDKVVLQVMVMQQEKKELKSLRDLDLKNILDPEQLTKYETEIQPKKPQVLHFGIHDRANCKVCTK